jgi:hypothetical protein
VDLRCSHGRPANQESLRHWCLEQQWRVSSLRSGRRNAMLSSVMSRSSAPTGKALVADHHYSGERSALVVGVAEQSPATSRSPSSGRLGPHDGHAVQVVARNSLRPQW